MQTEAYQCHPRATRRSVVNAADRLQDSQMMRIKSKKSSDEEGAAVDGSGLSALRIWERGWGGREGWCMNEVTKRARMRELAVGLDISACRGSWATGGHSVDSERRDRVRVMRQTDGRALGRCRGDKRAWNAWAWT